jgi:CheY-like chemotaxis protein
MILKPLLVVEDEPDQRALMKEILEAFGYQVATANNGQDALDYLMEHIPGLIFLDITMPVMSGRELLAAMYSGTYPHLERIPVVIVSAVTDFASIGQRYNCVAQLRKPADVESIVRYADRFVGR